MMQPWRRWGNKCGKELGGVLDTTQIENARKLNFERTLFPLASQRGTMVVEMWRDAAGVYYYSDTQEGGGRRGGVPRSGFGTNFNQVVPLRFRPFWYGNPQ
jgi:hypothetical protein